MRRNTIIFLLLAPLLLSAQKKVDAMTGEGLNVVVQPLLTDKWGESSPYNSKIRDCTYGIMQLNNSEAVHSTHCDFFNNREYTLIESHGCVGTVFEDCRFFANWGDAALFSFDREFILMGCAVYHPTENLGTMNLCEQPGAKNMFDSNPYDKDIRGREIGPDGHYAHAKGE